MSNGIILQKCNMAVQNKLLLKKKIKKQYVKTGNRPSASCSDPHINVGDIFFLSLPVNEGGVRLGK